VDDREKVTRQLQYVLEVENVDYQRLEVSSPGLDRLLRKPADFQRFAGQEVEITLKLAFQNRKKYRGVLEPQGEGWRLVFHDGKQEQALDFSLDEVREARLVPVIDFKGRRRGTPQPHPSDGAQEDGGQES
jgi:ribosome maturation factor RimP